MFFTRNGGEQTRDGSSAEERSHQNVKTSSTVHIICGMKDRRRWDSKGSRTASSPRFFYIKILMPNAIKLSRNELQGYGAVQHRGNVSFLLWAFFAIYICQLRVCDIHCCALINSQGDREGNCYCSQLRLTKVIGLEIFQSHLYPLMPILQL